MLGIDDPYVWLAYLLCLGSVALCVLYGAIRWNRGDEPVTPEDVQFATEEKEIEKQL